ncbi:MAG TPA: deoxyribodipyrimidine photo-lyase [Xanthobacteraceae bacterium]|jgi:deoxyribodipyrimidine photo-lyase|nr:deoxyribodipyrimidine photo-lyase [Xanthobacteraceae bacterium]
MQAKAVRAGQNQPVIVWFRDDLRLGDNPALDAAIRSGQPVVCAYVLDEESPEIRKLGGAARWWLSRSLAALDEALRSRGARLVLRRGAALDVVSGLAAEIGASTVFHNRRYDRSGIAIDNALAAKLEAAGISVETFQASLLFEPGNIQSKAGGPMRVFTPFWRAARSCPEPRPPLDVPKRINGMATVASEHLSEWALEPTAPDWATGLRQAWQPGEEGAHARLAEFVDARLSGYAMSRDRPDREQTSRLSPHLRFGEVSPFQLWHATRHALEAPRDKRVSSIDLEKFLSEIGWREFSYHLLHQCPDLATQNFQSRFDEFPWRTDETALRAWQAGKTGYPIVDAGMRQLWQTGWMHNRVRMIVGSFLIKHLLIDWRRGEEWFWDTLVDADPANNAASWQWVAGSGADAAPYFRIFNPILQGEKFDPEGDYVRRYVPELAGLSSDLIHKPWQAPPIMLATAGIELGMNYPCPIVDHAAARRRALDAFARMTRSG